MCAGPRSRLRRGPGEDDQLDSGAAITALGDSQALNELPQPQPPVAFGLLNVKPDPCIEET